MGAGRISLGRTALAPKAQIGAKPQPMYGYLRLQNPALNLAVPSMLALLPAPDEPSRAPPLQDLIPIPGGHGPPRSAQSSPSRRRPFWRLCMEKPRCPHCEAAIDIEGLLQGLVGYHRPTRSASAPCPNCQKGLEFQVRSGRLVMGYTYASGALHFEGLFDVGVPGLRCVEEGGHYHFLYGGKRFDVPD